MSIAAAILFGFAATPGGMPPGPCGLAPCSVETVFEHIHAWDGQTVSVRGWLTGCHGGFECYLQSLPGAWRPGRVMLIIDRVETLEPSLGRHDGSEIVLKARVTKLCTGEDGRPLCLDRGPALVPVAIESVLTRRGNG